MRLLALFWLLLPQWFFVRWQTVNHVLLKMGRKRWGMVCLSEFWHLPSLDSSAPCCLTKFCVALLFICKSSRPLLSPTYRSIFCSQVTTSYFVYLALTIISSFCLFSKQSLVNNGTSKWFSFTCRLFNCSCRCPYCLFRTKQSLSW